MYSRRLIIRLANVTSSANSATTPPASVRAFATSASRAATSPSRAPALSDVAPDQGHLFDQKQEEFRTKVADQARLKKEQERASASTTTPSHSSAADKSASSTSSSSLFPSSSSSSSSTSSSPTVSQVLDQGLGSLSTATGDAARKQDGDKARSGGRLSSLIYGTEEGREMDRDIERSFSQTLARGKYVHSIVFHEVKPDKVEEYVKVVGDWYPRMASMPENKVHLVGSWRTEVGDCDTFVHIWEYQRYAGYHASLHSIQNHPDFANFDSQLKHLIHSKKTSLMQEFRFWPTSPPRKLGGVFELRSYTLNPGMLLEWETHWQKGLAARREVMEGVGAWFVQIGSLNEVHHLWQFADLEERRARREQSWSVPGWGDTVHKTVPLIQSMKSRIMVPMPWSPIA